MDSDVKFEHLIAQARSWKMSGWDFSSLKGRWIEEREPWDFRQKVIENFVMVQSLVDLGTGGGEFLSSLSALPRNTLCTEGYRPNLKIARDRLKPLGVDVVYSFCDDNNVPNQRGALCFKEESLDLIISRHESFIAAEVFRSLKRKGLFLTQQVGTANLVELNELFGAEKPEPVWDLKECKKQIQNAGFEIIESQEARMKSTFKDVGAIACYLLSVPWQLPEFSIDKYLPVLRKIHNRMEEIGAVEATSTRFLAKSRRP